MNILEEEDSSALQHIKKRSTGNAKSAEQEETIKGQQSTNEINKKKKYYHRYTTSFIGLLTLSVLIASFILVSLISYHKTETNKLQEKRLYEDRILRKERRIQEKVANEVSKYATSINKKNDVVVLYAYFETPDSRLNILHFLSHALYDSADFIFILNGETDIDKLLPPLSNVRFIRRNNSCFDIGSQGEVLRMNDYEIVKKYKWFILMNASIRGPFLPTYVEGCWTDMFLSRINENVKLVGTTYNYWAEHIQSMLLATDSIGISILLVANETDTTPLSDHEYSEVYEGNPNSLVGLSKCPENKFRAVSAEISMSSLIKRAGYNISVLMTSATSAQIKGKFDVESNLPENTYNLASIHPYEIIFIKARTGWRDSMDIHLLNKLTEWHDDLNYSSWKACQSHKF